MQKYIDNAYNMLCKFAQRLLAQAPDIKNSSFDNIKTISYTNNYYSTGVGLIIKRIKTF